MAEVLVTWIGNTDLRATAGSPEAGLGPIAQALGARAFDRVALVSDYPEERTTPYVEWLRGRTGAALSVRYEPLSGPTEFGEIYQAATRAVQGVLQEAKGPPALGARTATANCEMIPA
ncbi:MAG: hypothetical protein ACYDA8_12995 [Deferrisomatales bacterium]